MVTVEGAVSASLVERARALAPLLLASADEGEANRRVSPSTIAALTETGLFRMFLPSAFGGGTDLATAIEVIEEVSLADAAAGWCLMIGVATSFFSGYLSEQAAQEIWGRDPRAVIVGALAPSGTAAAVDGGYRVSGHWGFGSGIEHAGWLLSGVTIYDDDRPRLRANGSAETRRVVTPAADVQILDTWHVAGLRGTGSHDYTMRDLFVPAERVIDLALDRPRYADALYRLPVPLPVTAVVAAPALGLARRAIDAFVELAAVKTPARGGAGLRDRGVIQAQVGEAEALYGSARAFLLEQVRDAWQTALAGAPVSFEQVARARLATAHAAAACARAVDLMYGAGGGTSLYDRSPLSRCFRDAHAITQHRATASAVYEMAGQAFLGLESAIATPV